MKFAILGSRDYPELDAVRAMVKLIDQRYPNSSIISGGAFGVDRTAERTAAHLEMEWHSYRPEKKGSSQFQILYFKNGQEIGNLKGAYASFRDAAFARNKMIIKGADVVIAFWFNKSSGTRNSIETAYRLDKTVRVIEPRK